MYFYFIKYSFLTSIADISINTIFLHYRIKKERKNKSKIVNAQQRNWVVKLSQIPLESINFFVRMFPVCGDVERGKEGTTMKEETERDT